MVLLWFVRVLANECKGIDVLLFLITVLKLFSSPNLELRLRHEEKPVTLKISLTLMLYKPVNS